jgi:hypothetical protein
MPRLSTAPASSRIRSHLAAVRYTDALLLRLVERAERQPDQRGSVGDGAEVWSALVSLLLLDQTNTSLRLASGAGRSVVDRRREPPGALNQV